MTTGGDNDGAEYDPGEDAMDICAFSDMEEASEGVMEAECGKNF